MSIRRDKWNTWPFASHALLFGSALILQGCVAAAFPIAAGGLIGERTLSRNGGNPDATAAGTQSAQSNSSEELVNADLAPVAQELPTASPPATSTRADFNAAFASASAASTTPSRELPPANTAVPPIPRAVSTPAPQPSTPVNATPSAADPAPSSDIIRPLPKPIPSTRQALGPSGINQLLSYANSRQIGSEEEPTSAMLSDRVSLEPVKAQCGGVAPTILIDLDPQGSLFDPANASRPPSGLARGLAQLRLSGVGVAWISGNRVDKLSAINRTLALSGLDIKNEDRILLIRTPADRKQTLREELSQISCLIAIAGDTRSDFDELYDYLKNPADAEALEPLIGDGWFLIPQPLL